MKKLIKKLVLTTIALTAIGVAVRAMNKQKFKKVITVDGKTGKILWY